MGWNFKETVGPLPPYVYIVVFVCQGDFWTHVVILLAYFSYHTELEASHTSQGLPMSLLLFDLVVVFKKLLGACEVFFIFFLMENNVEPLILFYFFQK